MLAQKDLLHKNLMKVEDLIKLEVQFELAGMKGLEA